MLQVVCSESELLEDGELVAVDDVLSRVATPFAGGYYGDHLDDVPWMFDQYAAGFSDRHDVVVLSGRVVAIAAIYVRLTLREDDGWAPIPGSARLAALMSTRDTWRPDPTIVWDTPVPPHPERGSSVRGYAERHEGDEEFNGWLFTLDDASFAPLGVPTAH
jgi:hypothetical protein